MLLTVWLSFVGVSLLFGLTPGPSVCFTVAHALKYGGRRTLPTILGQAVANCFQVVIVLFGANRILEQSAILFQILKIIGALYLVYLGYRQWTAGNPYANIKKDKNPKTISRAFIDGFVVCGTNPKAILFYAAFLPQFIVPGYDGNAQVIILAVTNVAIAGLVLGFYTLVADRVNHWFDSRKYWVMQNRLAGMFMMIAGVALSVVSSQ